MPEVSGYEDVYVPEGAQTEPEVPVEQRSDYLVRVKRGDIRHLESQAKKARDAEAAAEAANRRAAFALAGIDTESKDDHVALFVRGYDGDLKPEAIREAGQKFNVYQTGEQTTEGAENQGENKPDADLEDGEKNLQGEQDKLAQGSPPDTNQTGDPYKDAEATIQRVMKEGGQEKEAIGGALNLLANAAQNGDKRVIISKRDNAE